MKKYFIIIPLAFSLAISCTQKSMPVISARTSDPPAPISPAANVKPDLELGKIIFSNRCQRCHGLPEVNKYDSSRWVGILKIMSPRARLDPAQEVHLKAYVISNAAK